MGLGESDLLELIGLIYDAIDNAGAWSTFLERYAVLFAADVTFIQRHRLAQRSSELITAYGLNSPFRASYNEYYSRLNVWRDRGQHEYVQGRVIVDQQMCPRPVLVTTEFYNDYLVPMGAVHCAAGVISRERDEALTLAAMRGPRGGPFETTEQKALETLLPHVMRAQAVAKQLQVLHAGESLLDTLDVGIVFITAAASVTHCNRAAERILESGDGLSLRNGTLRAGVSSDAQLRAAIRSGLAAGVTLTCPAAVSIPRPSLKRAYQVMVAPYRPGGAFFDGLRTPELVLLVVDPETHRPSSPQLLGRLYGLTPREAALASALSAGSTVEQAAETLQMSYETARSHLRRIFDKTNTSRQSELIILLARVPKQAPAS